MRSIVLESSAFSCFNLVTSVIWVLLNLLTAAPPSFFGDLCKNLVFPGDPLGGEGCVSLRRI